MTIEMLIEFLFHLMPTIAQFIVMACPIIISVLSLCIAHSCRQDYLDLELLYTEQRELLLEELHKINQKL